MPRRTLSFSLALLIAVPPQALAQVRTAVVAPSLTRIAVPQLSAPQALTYSPLSVPSLSVQATLTVTPALKPVALQSAASVQPVKAIKSAPSVAVHALKALGSTPKLAETPALPAFYDQGAVKPVSEAPAVLSAPSIGEPSQLVPYLPAAKTPTKVIGAARTFKGTARAFGRRAWDSWPYMAIGLVAAAAHYFIGPEAAFAVLMAAGPCAAFRQMADGEALRLGIRDENRRRAAMEEMQTILRQFGRDAAKAGEADPEVQSRVDAEIMTRAALQGITHALEHFLKTLRAGDVELPAARQKLKELARGAVIGALKANGMSGDDEATIEKILDKTGLITKVVDWEIRHQVVESMLEAVREERKKAAKPGEAPGAAAQAKKEKEQGSGSAKPGLGALVAKLFSAPAQGDRKGPAQQAQQGQPELPPLPDTPMVHHLQLAGYEREEIEFFLGATRDVAETPASPLEGRYDEMRAVVETLSRPVNRPRSILLYGAEGVGKRAIVETLAREIAEKRYKGLEDARVLEFDASAAVGGNVEGLALQLRALLAKGKGKVILYLDHPGHLRNQNNNEHNFFKIVAPYMERGQVTHIVTADEAERRQLEDRGPFPFESIKVENPSIEKAAAMLEAHGNALTEHYALKAASGLYEAAARLAARYLARIGLPGSGLDLLERAFAARSKASTINRVEAEFRRRLERVARNLRRLQLGQEDEDTAMRRRNAIAEDLDTLYALKSILEKLATDDSIGTVTEAELAAEASRLSGIPAARMLESEREKLLGLEDKLKKRVVHQDEAVRAVAEAVRRARAGLKNPNKPIGSFLFLGPTGVGKTELTKALAETLFDSEANMVRLDMSEYMEPHSVSRLIGSPPGYVGYDAGGQLTEAVRNRPYSVVLLDEVEKAHPDVLNVLLQAMDDGRVTDGQGRTVSFGNVIFVLTSNLGSAHIMKLMQEKADRAQIKEDVMGAVRQHFRPEFINRLDETVIFNPLGREQAGPIIDIHLQSKVRKWLSDQGIELERASKDVVEALAALGFDPLYGGRPLERAVQRYVLNPLSAALLAESNDDDERVKGSRKAVLEVVDGVITPKLELLPAQAVAAREPRNKHAANVWRAALALPDAQLATEALESFLFGPPEKDLPSAEHGAFKPMGALKGGEAVETVTATNDDPNLKDPALDAASKDWTRKAKLTGTAAELFKRWLSKVARCAKSTNNLRPRPHQLVTYSLHEGAGFREWRVKGLPLTRSELLLNARIFENHYAADSKDEDEGWKLADELLGRGEYGRAELFEIKRLATATPGAEFGYFSDREGLTFWLRLPDEAVSAAAKPAETPPPAAVVEETIPESEAISAPGARISAEDAGADAPTQYRFLTQDAPAHMRQLHALVAALLSATNQISVFWGFRFARAALGQDGFEPMKKFLPPLNYLNSDARSAYLTEESLQGYYGAQRAADPGLPGAVDRATQGGRHSSSTQLDGAREIARSVDILSADLSKRLVDGLINPYPKFYRNHRVLVLTRRLTWPLWIAAAGVVVASFIHGELILFLGWPTWLRVISSIALLAGVITNNVAAYSDWIYEKADHSYDEVRGKIEAIRLVAPRLQPQDRKKAAEHFARIVRGRWTKNKRENYDGRGELQTAHLAAAEGLEELRADLDPVKARELAALVMARAEKPAKNSTAALADRLTPLMMLELLDDAQKSRALALARQHVTFGNTPSSTRFLRLAREGRLPVELTEEVLQRIVRALESSVDEATLTAMSETLSVLSANQPENIRLATFEAVFATRANFNGQGANEKPVAFYEALRRLSPHRKGFERMADHLLASPRPKIAQLTWLLAQDGLDAARRQSAIDQLVAAGEGDARADATWNAIPVVARMTQIPLERRIRMVLEALNRLSAPNENSGRYNGGNEFTYYARAVEAVRLLAELEAQRPAN